MGGLHPFSCGFTVLTALVALQLCDTIATPEPIATARPVAATPRPTRRPTPIHASPRPPGVVAPPTATPYVGSTDQIVCLVDRLFSRGAVKCRWSMVPDAMEGPRTIRDEEAGRGAPAGFRTGRTAPGNPGKFGVLLSGSTWVVPGTGTARDHIPETRRSSHETDQERRTEGKRPARLWRGPAHSAGGRRSRVVRVRARQGMWLRNRRFRFRCACAQASKICISAVCLCTSLPRPT